MRLDIRHPAHPQDAKHYDTARLRQDFVIETVFAPDEAALTYSHYDRIIAGGVMPVTGPVELTGSKALAAETFLQRRELGAINVGGPGCVTVDGHTYPMHARDGLYVGMGAKTLRFESGDAANPAKFYINCAPAHKTYPTVKIDISQANPRPLGAAETCNKRTIYQYLHPAVMQTCQLCMGLTVLEPGSNWNSMPCHTHERRMEVYFYFDLKPGNVVFHMMGEPQQTRHVVLHNEQAVISPSWSIHTGVGTGSYAFIWGMCGENQDFDDMDHMDPMALR
ncbi:MAG: 5-dehydro-4-deoxy-D-glucuronate isomerase [Oscillospiraceae bacterium]|jgi:4-deoxy-L-threo-5-hexosulose-uronate ketol-isomerase|nr:5-dehydro-4-deoxy-D-glucuronate isomerase [Oscillospiraceae bacterium]